MSEAAPPARRFSLGRALLGFLLGLVAGYGGTLLAYIGWASATGYRDFEGAAAMGVAFVFAPLMAIVTAFVLAVLLGRGRRLR